MKSKAGISVLQIAEKLHMDPQTVRRWLRAEQIKPVRLVKRRGGSDIPYYGPEALKIADAHRQKDKPSSKPNIDESSGLTWQQKLMREKAIELEMSNARQRGINNHELMMTADHHRILGAVMTQLEQAPGKIQSELGLSEPQGEIVRKILDDVRTNAAKLV
jgi:predicted transcriptional regulator